MSCCPGLPFKENCSAVFIDGAQPAEANGTFRAHQFLHDLCAVPSGEYSFAGSFYGRDMRSALGPSFDGGLNGSVRTTALACSRIQTRAAVVLAQTGHFRLFAASRLSLAAKTSCSSAASNDSS